MNKSELIDQVADTAGITKTDAKGAIEATFTAIAQAAATDQVRIPGFGTFSTKTRGARQGRNPRTGEPMQISAKSRLAFKPSKGV